MPFIVEEGERHLTLNAAYNSRCNETINIHLYETPPQLYCYYRYISSDLYTCTLDPRFHAQ